MRQSCSEEKRLKIKESMKATRKRRSEQICRVFKVKIDQSKLTCGIDPQTGQKAFSVALRPEKIIEEMLTDPATGKLEDGGSLKIRTIIGRPNLPETIRWEVLNNVNVGNNSLNGVNINAIFSNASYKVQ